MIVPDRYRVRNTMSKQSFSVNSRQGQDNGQTDDERSLPPILKTSDSVLKKLNYNSSKKKAIRGPFADNGDSRKII